MGRNWFIDDPERDAEEFGEDTRPLLGHCEVCDAPLHGSTSTEDADDGYEIESGVFVCDDCLREYFKDKKII